MGKLQIPTTIAFQLAVAADVLSLIEIRQKLEKINPMPGSPHGDLAHCVGGILQNLDICDADNMALIAMQLESYAIRVGAKDRGVEEKLRATPALTKIRNTLEKFVPAMA